MCFVYVYSFILIFFSVDFLSEINVDDDDDIIPNRNNSGVFL